MTDLSADPSSLDPNPRPRRWWAALLLGLLQPGLGQVYNGQAGKGAAVYALGWVGVALAAATILLPIPFAVSMLFVAFCLLLALAAVGESAWIAYRRGSELRLHAYNRWYVYLALILLVFSILVNLLAQFIVRRAARRQGLVSR